MASGKLAFSYSADADRDLMDIWEYLAVQASPDPADRQLRKIDDACRLIAEWPFSGRARDELRRGLRSILAAPYVVFYRVHKTRVEIVRVLHGRRDLDDIFLDL